MRLLLLTAAAPLVLLAACASAPPVASNAPPANDLAPGASSYGMFLAGESALNSGRSTEAAKFFDQARSQTGDR
jgi:hypothetical protein